MYCCSHCWHTYCGVILMVVPDGHTVMQCCRCGAQKLEHREHCAAFHHTWHPTTTWTTPTWTFTPSTVRNGPWT